MAKQKGIIKLSGTIDDISFYKSHDGHIARMKGGVDGKRIAKDPAFARTRENAQEFKEIARSSKLLRDSIRPLLLSAKDSRSANRLFQVFGKVKNLDGASNRGDRKAGLGIATAPGKALLKGFDFNEHALLRSTLVHPYTVNQATGEIDIQGFVPWNSLVYPPSATHFGIRSAWSKVNFLTGESEVFFSPATILPIDNVPHTIQVTPSGVPSVTGTSFYVLMVEFYQQLNGSPYALKDQSFNALCIVEVA